MVLMIATAATTRTTAVLTVGGVSNNKNNGSLNGSGAFQKLYTLNLKPRKTSVVAR